jgi:hypothetical protein
MSIPSEQAKKYQLLARAYEASNQMPALGLPARNWNATSVASLGFIQQALMRKRNIVQIVLGVKRYRRNQQLDNLKFSL